MSEPANGSDAPERAGVKAPAVRSDGCDVVVVGASAGGVEALTQLVSRLPAGFPAAVVIVLHVSPRGTSVLPAILARAGALPAAHVVDGEPLDPGRLYVAPPDQHVVVVDGRVRLERTPRVNGHRPAIDPLFRSAATGFGRTAIGVVLSGALDDGSAGLTAIKAAGGVAVVQEPEDALYPSMPLAAIRHVEPDYVVPVAAMSTLLTKLADGVLADPAETANEEAEVEKPLDLMDVGASNVPGELISITCPECSGAIWRATEHGGTQLRCHVGHAYSVESFLAQHAASVEEALWTAIRVLEERATIARGLGERMSRDRHSPTADRFEDQARTAEEHADRLRHVAANLHPFPDLSERVLTASGD